ncbi:MAG: ABC transporter permease [Lachnospiraceae bacterium]|nr:ABC transporter permease [Lachnospiraceae bacterium]
MNLKILKKDLKRKKSMNLILLIFIFLATTFIAGSLNNLLVVMNGTDYFMEESGIADFIFVTLGGSREDLSEHDKNAEVFLKESDSVKKYTVDEMLYLSKKQISKGDNGRFELNNTAMLSSFHIAQQKFFDTDNNLITDMEDGTIYLKRRTMQINGLKPGDTVYIHTDNGYRKKFELKGTFKDAFMGSDMMGTDRYIISEADFQEMLLKSGLPYGRNYSVFCDNLEKFEQEYNDIGLNVIFGGNQALIKTTYIMDMIVAAVLLVVSLCLVIISVIMLRFTIIFTVNEDYKEIGIMKAIGMKDMAIRKLYLSKYFAIALCGSLFGFAASIPFSRVLLMRVTENIIIKNEGQGVWLQGMVSIMIVGVVVMFGYFATGKIKKLTPMDAIRSGNNGERFGKKGLLRLSGSKWKPTTFMAGNDVLCELKKYLVLLVTSAVGVWLVVMPVNTINTLCSESIGAWFAIADCDFYINEEDRLSELILSADKNQYYAYMNEVKDSLEQEGIAVSKVMLELTFRFKVRNGEKSYNSFSLQGLGTDIRQYFYDEGEPPVYENEIAITHVVAEKIGAHIGDTVYITMGEEEKPYVVTAVYQSMNNMGEGIRFPEETELDYSRAVGGFGIQVLLKERPDEEQLLETIRKTKDIMPGARVQTVVEFIDSMIGGISDQLRSLKSLILAVVIIINILVVVLMQKMFLIREQGEMGMLKAIGFSDVKLISWQTKRIMLVLFAGILLGTVTGTPFSELTSGQVFKIMGASKIEFEVNIPEVYIFYPIILFVAIVTACIITMQKVRKISPQEMNNIE